MTAHARAFDQGYRHQQTDAVDTDRGADRDYVAGLAAARTDRLDRELAATGGPVWAQKIERRALDQLPPEQLPAYRGALRLDAGAGVGTAPVEAAGTLLMQRGDTDYSWHGAAVITLRETAHDVTALAVGEPARAFVGDDQTGDPVAVNAMHLVHDEKTGAHAGYWIALLSGTGVPNWATTQLQRQG